MKKLLFGLVVIALLLVSMKVATHVYRYDFHAWAVTTEAEKAGLVAKTGELDGATFAYFEAGQPEQPSVIMIHGFGATKENWLRFAAPFQPHYHVVALDLAAHGESAVDLVPSYHVVEQAAFVVRVMDKLGIAKATLIGNSMGGAIAAAVGALHPERVSRLVLISPAGFQDVASELDQQVAQGRNPLIANSPEEFVDLVDFATSRPPYIPDAILQVQGEKAAARAALNAQIFEHLQQDRRSPLNQQFSNIKAPMLILWGEEDRAINVGNLAAWQAALPQAQTQVYSGIGHVAMIEIPKQSAQDALAFLARP